MSGLTSKTVFTADVVTYDFLPEKYASDKGIVIAELNIFVKCNWQKAIDTWFKELKGSTDSDAKSASMKVCLMAQTQMFSQSASQTGEKGATNRVGAGPIPLAHFNDNLACDIVQQIVYKIATSCWVDPAQSTSADADTASYYYKQGGPNATAPGKTVHDQLKSILIALLAATTTEDSETNTLSIDLEKIKADNTLPESSDLTKPWLSVPVENGPTTILSELLSGFAFVPVLNRLIAGGGFSIGTTGGGSTESDSTNGEWSFDMNEGSGGTADGTSDLIHNDAHLVFPVRIMFADDGVTKREDGGYYGGGHSLVPGKVLPPGRQVLKDGMTGPFTTLTQEADGSARNWVYTYADADEEIFESGVKAGQAAYAMIRKSGGGDRIGKLYVLWTDLPDTDIDLPSTKDTEGNISFQLNIIFSNNISGPSALA